MVKRFYLGLFLLCLSFAVYANDDFGDKFFDKPFYSRMPNDYVLYYDERGDSPVLVGIMYLEENCYLIRYYDYELDQNIQIRLTVEYSPKKITINDINFIEGEESVESIYKYTNLFMTLINLEDRIDTSIYPKDPSFTQTFDVDGVSHEQVIQYKYWVPVFQMHSIHQTAPTKSSVSLVAIGRPSMTDISVFEDFKYFPSESPSEEVLVTPGEPKVLTYGDINIGIDSNWVSDEDGILLLPIVTHHDAALVLNTMESDGSLSYPGLHVAYLRMLNNRSFIPANSISIRQYSDRAVLEYSLYDSATQKYTVVNEMFFEVGNTLYIISLSAFKTIFNANSEYFLKLLNSTQIIK